MTASPLSSTANRFLLSTLRVVLAAIAKVFAAIFDSLAFARLFKLSKDVGFSTLKLDKCNCSIVTLKYTAPAGNADAGTFVLLPVTYPWLVTSIQPRYALLAS